MRAAPLLMAAGGAATIAIVAWIGASSIGTEVLQAAWAVPPAMAIHVAQQWGSGIAWRWCIGGTRPGDGRYFVIRVIRESVNTLLPVAHLGGNLVGIRLLMQRGVAGTDAAAGTAIDVTLEGATQLAFALMGLAALAWMGTGGEAIGWLAGGLAALAGGLAAFVLAQRGGNARVIDRIAGPLIRIFPRLSRETLHGLFAGMRARQAQGGMLLRAFLLHLLSLLLGIAETWLVLTAMGRPTTLLEAVALESLGMAARGAGFAIPGSLGVQEAGFILVGSLTGVPAEQAVALSMVKRLRELVFGLAGLAAWQWEEGRRLLR